MLFVSLIKSESCDSMGARIGTRIRSCTRFRYIRDTNSVESDRLVPDTYINGIDGVESEKWEEVTFTNIEPEWIKEKSYLVYSRHNFNALNQIGNSIWVHCTQNADCVRMYHHKTTKKVGLFLTATPFSFVHIAVYTNGICHL